MSKSWYKVVAGLSKVLQWCYRIVTDVLLGCNVVDTRLFYLCVTGVLQDVTGVVQGCDKGVKGCFKDNTKV